MKYVIGLEMYKIKVFGGVNYQEIHRQGSIFMFNEKSVIDAGCLLTSLKEKCADIETIWLTHSHLDHIVDIAFVLDTYYAQRKVPLKIRALKETLEALQKHFFNDDIWPDFSSIPLTHAKGMSLEYEAIKIGECYRIDEETTIEPFATDHTVPSCGYIVSKENSAILIGTDTHSLESVISSVSNKKAIRSLVIECSFPSAFNSLAKVSKHLTPSLLFKGLKSLEKKGLKLYINHIKPSYVEKITAEIQTMKGDWDVTILKDGDTIDY